MDKSLQRRNVPGRRVTLSEPPRSIRDSRHLLQLRYLCIGCPHSTSNGATALWSRRLRVRETATWKLSQTLRNANLRISDGRGVCHNTDLECGILLKTVGLRDLEPHSPLSPRVGVTAGTNFSSDIGDRHREARGSPRGEGSLSAFHRGGDGNYADRELTLTDLVLSACLKQQSRRRYAANGFAFVPIRARDLVAVLDASQTPRSDLTT